MLNSFLTRAGLSALTVAAMASTAISQEQSAAEFFQGRDVTINITGSLGGVYGTYTTILAEYMTKYVEGNPNFIVVPLGGAGGARSLNYLAEAAPKDGSVLLMAPFEALLYELFELEDARYDSGDINWIGRIAEMVSVLIVSDQVGVSDLEGAAQKQLITGSQGPADHFAVNTMLTNRIVGTDFRVVLGYDGMSSLMLAMEQGEIDAFAPTWSTVGLRADEVAAGKIIPILSFAEERNPDYPDVPAIGEYVQAVEDEAFLDIYLSQNIIGRALAAPNGIPEDRVAALRAGFDAAVADPGFIEALASRGLEMNILSGDELQSTIEEIQQTPPELVQAAKEIYQELVAAAENR